MPNRAASAAFYGGSAVVTARTPAAQAPSTPTGAAQSGSLVNRAKALWPYVAGGFVVLAVGKLLYEKYVIKDAAELKGVRIGWYNFITVGVMAMVFALGVQVVAGAVQHGQNTMAANGSKASTG